MIEFAALQNFEQGDASSTLWIGHAPDDEGDAGVYDGPRAHGTGLLGDVKNAVGQAPVADGARRLRDRDDFGVRRRVFEQFDLVVSLADQFSIPHDDGADRHLALAGSHARLLQGQPHPCRVGIDRFVHCVHY